MGATVTRIAPARSLLLRIELKWIEPLVYRRVLVPETITLGRLHRTIQAVMGWQDYHLHEFMIAGQRYGVPDPDWDDPGSVHPEARVRLARCLGRHKRFTYTYDFGDDWEHQIIVEKVLPPDQLPHPVCLDGEHACPPEDVGGSPGYTEFLEAVTNPGHPEHEHYLSWIGGHFDPTAFDLVDANRRLARIKL